ncbi:MAG: DUF3768 domain-containing protein [Alphaproteobacteria bacterium]|nr:DUF3768 domain-containing protein [Alphaproteobacteria bacterium]
MNKNKIFEIARLNDEFRRDLNQGKVILSPKIGIESAKDITNILNLIKNYKNFNHYNDPYKERDFGSLSYNGNKIYWKIDYYDEFFEYHSKNPSNPNITNRIITIMFADEY